MNGASSAGTQAYASAHPAAEGWFRKAGAWTVSSLGCGTYLGKFDEATDCAYEDSLVAAVRGGINFIDTAANYRFQRSERNIGRALVRLADHGIQRDQIVLCTKAGYLTFDGSIPENPRAWFEETFVRPGIADFADLIAGSHCMTPAYLRHQIAQSLSNLGVEHIDVFYVHNPETQLTVLTRASFQKRLRAAFEEMEAQVSAGRIGCYGVATWDGFRVPENHGVYLPVKEVLALAKEAAGGEHHFRFIQLPYSMAMTEALTLENQDGRPFLLAAEDAGIRVVTSASLMQAQVLGRIPPEMRRVAGVETDAQTAIQFARSAPGVLTSLVGMSKEVHVTENLHVSNVPPVSEGSYSAFFA